MYICAILTIKNKNKMNHVQLHNALAEVINGVKSKKMKPQDATELKALFI